MQHNTAALIRASLSNSSLNKHLSALNCFHDFERVHNVKHTWPLTEPVVSDFVSYALLTSVAARGGEISETVVGNRLVKMYFSTRINVSLRADVVIGCAAALVSSDWWADSS
jgi:hypothetical protein